MTHFMMSIFLYLWTFRASETALSSGFPPISLDVLAVSFPGFLASAHSLNIGVPVLSLDLGPLHTMPGWLCLYPDFSYFSSRLMTSKYFSLRTLHMQLPINIHQSPETNMSKNRTQCLPPTHSTSYFPTKLPKPELESCLLLPSPSLSSSKSPRPAGRSCS